MQTLSSEYLLNIKAMNTKIIYSFLFTLIIVSCEDAIDVTLPETEKKIAIDAFIETDHKTEVVITETVAFDSPTDPGLLHGAEIIISDNSTPPKSAQLYEVEGKGYYTTNENYLGEIGKVYTLNIKYNGKTYTATDSLKRTGEMDSIFVKKNESYEKYYSVFVSGQELTGAGDNYRWVVYYNGKPLLHPYFIFAKSDQYIESKYIDRSQVLDGSFANETMGISIKDNDKIQVKLMSLSQTCLEHYWALETIGQQGPFAAPAANLPTNFDNGAIGLFRASATAWTEEVTAPYDPSIKLE